MTDWVIVLILLGEVVLLARLDRMVFGTWLTPVAILAVPYAIVMTLAFLFARTLGFIPLNVESVLVWAVGLPVFWLGGLAMALSLGKPIRSQAKTNRPFCFENESGKLAMLLAWLCIPVIVLHLFTSLGRAGGLPGLGTEDFEFFYGGGLGAHLLVLCTVLFIFLVGTTHKGNKATILTLVLLATLILVRQVKYSLILPLLAGLAYRIISGRTRLSVVGVLASIIAVYAIFNIAYLIGIWAIRPEDLARPSTYSWALHHFLAYIFAGVLPLGELVRQGIGTVHGDPRVTFSNLANLYAFVTSSQPVSSGNEYSAVISLDGFEETNVSTLFGPLLIGLGPWGALVYTWGLGFVSYVVFAVAMVTRNCWAVVMWLFVASMLAFGWFASFFVLLIAVEAPAFCVLLACLFWLTPMKARKAGPVRDVAGQP